MNDYEQNTGNWTDWVSVKLVDSPPLARRCADLYTDIYAKLDAVGPDRWRRRVALELAKAAIAAGEK